MASVAADCLCMLRTVPLLWLKTIDTTILSDNTGDVHRSRVGSRRRSRRLRLRALRSDFFDNGCDVMEKILARVGRAASLNSNKLACHLTSLQSKS